jgi:hypothetical protein
LEQGDQPGHGHHEEGKDGEREQEETPGLEDGLGGKEAEPSGRSPRAPGGTAEKFTQPGTEGGLAAFHDQVEDGQEQGTGTESLVRIGTAGHVGPEPKETEDERSGSEVIEQVGGERGSAKQMDRGLDDIERSVKLVEAQLQSIENFFGYLNDEIVSITTPEKFSLLDFRQLSDSIAMTKQMLEETAESVGALDSYNREKENRELASHN